MGTSETTNQNRPHEITSCEHDVWDTCPRCGEYACTECGNGHDPDHMCAFSVTNTQRGRELARELAKQMEDALIYGTGTGFAKLKPNQSPKFVRIKKEDLVQPSMPLPDIKNISS